MPTDEPAAYNRKEVILSSASGDFDGNGESENVYIKMIHGDPVDDAGYWEYSVVFSNTKFPPVAVENHEAEGCQVENHGNTDGRPGDELAVIYYGMMAKVITEVYGFNGKKWEQLSSAVTSRQ
jgi:hypothetical protein